MLNNLGNIAASGLKTVTDYGTEGIKCAKNAAEYVWDNVVVLDENVGFSNAAILACDGFKSMDTTQKVLSLSHIILGIGATAVGTKYILEGASKSSNKRRVIGSVALLVGVTLLGRWGGRVIESGVLAQKGY